MESFDWQRNVFSELLVRLGWDSYEGSIALNIWGHGIVND